MVTQNPAAGIELLKRMSSNDAREAVRTVAPQRLAAMEVGRIGKERRPVIHNSCLSRQRVHGHMRVARPATVLAVRPTRHRYGELRRQVGDLWLPEEKGADPLAVVVLIHGGYWRGAYTKRLMNPLARAVAERGWAAWNIEYRRTGTLGGGGGWPATFADLGAAVDHLRNISGLDTDRVVTCGHSAGGHLALWAAARHKVPAGTPGTPALVRVLGAISLAGVVDLRRGAQLNLGAGAVVQFLGATPEEQPERYLAASPFELLPIGVAQVLVHGLDDTVVPPFLSEDYARAARELGDEAVYVPIAGLGHREVIDPSSKSWPLIAEHLRRLLEV